MIDRFRAPYGFLSNFYACKVEYKGMVYPSVEHAFQAAKTADRGDQILISKAPSPCAAKRLGREVTLRGDWKPEVRLQVMLDLVRAKFSDPVLLVLLAGTGDEELVEGNNWHDNFWGHCSCRGCQGSLHHNHLGKLLMQVREEVQQELDPNDPHEMG